MSQLQLRLFARLARFSGPPPERAVWRELLDAAIEHSAYQVGDGRMISAERVHHVGQQMYLHADAAGLVVEVRGDRLVGISTRRLADECRMSPRSAAAARRILTALGLGRPVGPADLSADPRLAVSRRLPEIWRMHVDGLEWSAVRAEIDRRRRRARGPAEPPPALPLAEAGAEPLAPTAPQLSGIASMRAELGVEDDHVPDTRADASALYADLLHQVQLRRAARRVTPEEARRVLAAQRRR